MKKLIFYDLDGTLVDTRRDIVEAVNHMMGAMSRRPLEPAAAESYVGRGLHYLISRCLETKDPKLIEKGSKIYRDYYVRHMLDHTQIYPGVREVLEHFKGRRQYVITNKPDPFASGMLKALGIAAFFDTIVSGNGQYPQKPDPSAIHSLQKNQHCGLDEILLIGDSTIDFETGSNAGVETVLVGHGFMPVEDLKRHPAAVVRDFTELLRLAQTKSW
ncbi:MAG: hypothetical protein A2Z83_08305 [Omnitrophica bacterium GWA2_52_8]|nr:MAG: hypothetical protein A2Z83_08305 [Omnitrophica bacterium GWA2_52_8]